MKKALFVLLLFGFKIFAQVPTASLIGFYPFSGNANDASGNNLNGTVYGATLTTDRFGNTGSAYMFNGSSNYIALPAASYTVLNNYSWSVWVRPNAVPSSAGFVYCMGESGSPGYNQCLAYQNSQMMFAGSYNTGGGPLQSYAQTPTVSTNQWIHLVVTRSNSLISVYMNGTLYSSSNSVINNQNVLPGTPPILAIIGARCNFNSGTFFSGAIDDIRVYSSILTQTDVTALLNESCFQTPPVTNYQSCLVNPLSLTATPSPSSTLGWYATAASTNAIATGTMFTPSFTAAGVYTYYLSSSSCSMYPKIAVNVSVNPNPTISVNDGTVCSGQNFTLNPVGATNYTFSGGTNVVSPLTTTAYTITGSNALGCLASNSVVATVSVLSSPTLSINNGFVCSGNSFTLSPTGALNYSFSSGTSVVSPTVNTTYTVYGNNNNACNASVVAFVGVAPSPTIYISGPTAICLGSGANLTANGGNIYTWNTGSGSTVIAVNPTVNTSYFLTGVNQFGCVGTASTLVTVNPIPVLSVNSGTICQGQNFVITPTGANSYTFSGGTAVVSPVVNTNYTITGSSAAGCLAASAVVSSVTVLASPTVAVLGGSVCAGQSFSLLPSGAVTYTYSSGTSVVTPVSTTTYTVSGTAANGCVNAIPALATVSVNALPNITVPSGSICAGGSYTITPSGALTYTYSSGTAVVSPVANTTYSVYGSSAAGCVNTTAAVLTVTVNAVPVISVNSGTICQGRSFTITPTGANSYTYSGGTSVVSPVVNTNYTITGSSAAGCLAASAVLSSVTVLASPTVAVLGGSVCAGQSFSLTPSGAVTYTYSSGTSVVIPVSTTTYTVSGTAANGCVNAIPALATVSVNALPNITVPSGSICAGSSFTITPSGAATYTYSSGTAVVSPVANTTYSVYGTSAAGCVNTTAAVLSVIVNAVPVISVNSGSICLGRSFTISPTGANSYTYSGGTSVVSPVVNTTYTVTGSSAAGCLAASAVVSSVTVLASPTVAVLGGSVCAGQSFSLLPSGAMTYTYSSGTSVVTPVATTTYSVSGTAANGCVNAIPAITTVSVNALPNITVPSGSICAGGSYTMNPSGAVTYTFSSGTAVVSPVANTTYSVYGTNAAGCVNTTAAVLTVTVNALPVLTVNSGSICQGSSFTITPTGANSYTYSGGASVVAPVVNTNYTITGSSAAGCLAASAVLSSVTVLASPTVAVLGGSVCAGQSFSLTPSGAVTYTYSSGTSVVIPVSTTTYTVSGTAANGCVNAIPALATVSVNALPNITVPSGSICAGSSFTITPSGAVTYTYSSGTAVVSPVANTTYSVYGSSASGCVNTTAAVLTVTVNAVPVISVNSGSVCAGQSFSLTPSGAVTYTYSSGTPVVTPVSTTTYAVNGTAANGCLNAISAIATVTVYAIPNITVPNGSICAGDSFTITPSGAVTYTYSSGTAVVSPSVSTTYTVYGSSAVGCVSGTPSVVHLTVMPLPSISIPSLITICTGDTYTINPTGANTYSYSGGSQTVAPNVTTGYTVTGMSLAGCIGQAYMTVSVQPGITLSVNGNTVICEGQNSILNVSGASTYTWSNGMMGSSVSVSPSVSAIFTIQGQQGQCYAILSQSVQVNANPIVNITGGTGTLCIGESMVLGAGGALSYTWSNGATTNTIAVTPTVTSVYTLTGKDANNCIDTTTWMQYVDACLAIDKRVLQNEAIALYPNPNNGQFVIVKPDGIDQLTMEIYNDLGMMIYGKNILEAKSEIDLRHLENGVYLIKLKANHSAVKYIKVVKE